MSGPGAIGNQPVNTGYTAPTQGAGQAKEPGMDLVQDLVLGGKVRTAQAQPPGKPFTETMGAAFTAMGAAVTNFFKGLGDRMATIELPQLPRIVSPMVRLTDFMNSRVAGRDMAGARFVPQNESSVDPQTFGGAMSTLSKITYRDGTVGMFKGDEGKGVITHNASITAGIPAEIAAANLSARAVATSRLDGALGLNLVPPTEFAVHDGRSGTVQEFAKGQTLMTETRTRIPVSDMAGVTNFLNGRPLPEAQEPFDFDEYLSLFDRATANEDLGFGSTLDGPDFLALKEALGKQAARLNEGIPRDPSMTQKVKALVEDGTIFFTKLQRTSNELALDSPSVQQSMSNAHVMDLLCGQLDRNPGNFIFVNAGDGGLQVKLIDNDLSFGNKFTSLSESSMNKIGSPMLPTSLPRLIDAGTAARVLAMTPDALRAELADTGLGDDEMNAAASRLTQLQGHILQIQAGVVPGGQLVNDWNAQTYQSLMQAPDNYVQRSMENIAAAKGAAPGIGTTGAAPAGAASGLPQVELASLAHLFKHEGRDLTPEQMNRLDTHLKVEYSSENMSFLRSGAALMAIQTADGSTRPVDTARLAAGESVKLTADLPVIKQWAERFVRNDAAEQVNVSSRQRIALESALSNMPDDAATATDAQKQALAGAMKDCFAEIVKVVTKDSLRRAFA